MVGRWPIAWITAPTLIVHGDSDRVVPVANAHLLAQKILGARVVVLEDSGHACSLDQKEAFNREVVGFLGG